MSLRQSLVTAAGLAALLIAAGQTDAGTSFRIEIGPAVAAGTGNKVKDYKKLVLVMRPQLCERPASVRMTGTAEGLVGGVRRSIPLQLIAVDPADGVYGVQQQWTDTGYWVLRLDGSCPNPKASASTIVAVDKTRFIRERTEVLREPATRAQVEAALADLARAQRSVARRGTAP